MRKKIKIIHLLFIWLTSLFFISHGMIPHYHHFDSVFEHSGQSGHPDEHPKNAPFHCHAFNDLVFNQAVTFSSKVQTGNNHTAFIFESDLRLRIATNTDRCNNFVYQDKSHFSEVFLNHSPTRGPPSLV